MGVYDTDRFKEKKDQGSVLNYSVPANESLLPATQDTQAAQTGAGVVRKGIAQPENPSGTAVKSRPVQSGGSQNIEVYGQNYYSGTGYTRFNNGLGDSPALLPGNVGTYGGQRQLSNLEASRRQKALDIEAAAMARQRRVQKQESDREFALKHDGMTPEQYARATRREQELRRRQERNQQLSQAIRSGNIRETGTRRISQTDWDNMGAGSASMTSGFVMNPDGTTIAVDDKGNPKRQNQWTVEGKVDLSSDANRELVADLNNWASNQWATNFNQGVSFSRHDGGYDESAIPKGLFKNGVLDTSMVTSQKQLDALKYLMETDRRSIGLYGRQPSHGALVKEAVDKELADSGLDLKRISFNEKLAYRNQKRFNDAARAVDTYQTIKNNGGKTSSSLIEARTLLRKAGFGSSDITKILGGDYSEMTSRREKADAAVDRFRKLHAAVDSDVKGVEPDARNNIRSDANAAGRNLQPNGNLEEGMSELRASINEDLAAGLESDFDNQRSIRQDSIDSDLRFMDITNGPDSEANVGDGSGLDDVKASIDAQRRGMNAAQNLGQIGPASGTVERTQDGGIRLRGVPRRSVPVDAGGRAASALSSYGRKGQLEELRSQAMNGGSGPDIAPDLSGTPILGTDSESDARDQERAAVEARLLSDPRTAVATRTVMDASRKLQELTDQYGRDTALRLMSADEIRAAGLAASMFTGGASLAGTAAMLAGAEGLATGVEGGDVGDVLGNAATAGATTYAGGKLVEAGLGATGYLRSMAAEGNAAKRAAAVRAVQRDMATARDQGTRMLPYHNPGRQYTPSELVELQMQAQTAAEGMAPRLTYDPYAPVTPSAEELAGLQAQALESYANRQLRALPAPEIRAGSAQPSLDELAQLSNQARQGFTARQLQDPSRQLPYRAGSDPVDAERLGDLYRQSAESSISRQPRQLPLNGGSPTPSLDEASQYASMLNQRRLAEQLKSPSRQLPAPGPESTSRPVYYTPEQLDQFRRGAVQSARGRAAVEMEGIEQRARAAGYDYEPPAPGKPLGVKVKPKTTGKSSPAVGKDKPAGSGRAKGRQNTSPKPGGKAPAKTRRGEGASAQSKSRAAQRRKNEQEKRRAIEDERAQRTMERIEDEYQLQMESAGAWNPRTLGLR